MSDDAPKPGPSVWTVPDGDERERLTCLDCGFIHYDNPKIVTGVVATWDGRYLMCRRAIEPRAGFWTVPAGFLELNETTGDGARREAWEEARIDVEITGLIGVYEIPRISQLYVIHSGRMTKGDHAPGPESTDTRLLDWNDIPWEELAFPSIRWALERHRDGLPPAITQAPPRGVR